MKRPLIITLLVLATLTGAACGESHPQARLVIGGKHHYKPGDGSIDLKNNEVLIRAGGTSDDAKVGIDGGLSIGGRPIEIGTEGRAALKQYNADAVAIEQHGIALGVAGAKFGLDTLKEVLNGLFDGTAEAAGKHADEGAHELEASAHELCSRLGSMYQAQETAAATIQEFKPYAVISQRQVSDCFKDDDKRDDRDHDEDDDPDQPRDDRPHGAT